MGDCGRASRAARQAPRLKRPGRAAKRARAPRAPSAQSLGGYMRHSTRLAGCLLAVVVASPGLVGMGGFGGGREEGLPARDFSATFTDVDGIRMTVTRVTSGADASLERSEERRVGKEC